MATVTSSNRTSQAPDARHRIRPGRDGGRADLAGHGGLEGGAGHEQDREGRQQRPERAVARRAQQAREHHREDQRDEVAGHQCDGQTRGAAGVRAGQLGAHRGPLAGLLDLVAQQLEAGRAPCGPSPTASERVSMTSPAFAAL